MLEEIQNLPNGTLVVACSNIPSLLDAALMRRFKKWFKIPLPNIQCRESIFEKLFRGMNTSQSEYPQLVKRRLQRLCEAPVARFARPTHPTAHFTHPQPPTARSAAE